MMKRTTWMFLGLIAAAAVALAPDARAQHAEDAKATLAETTAALRNVESLTFKSRRYATSILKDIIDSSGEVKIYRPKGQSTTYVMATGRIKQPGAPDKQLTVTHDGKVVRWLDHKTKTLMARPMGDSKAKAELTDLGQLLPAELLAADPFAQDMKAELIERIGLEEVLGEVCEIISAGSKAGDGARIWAISQVDRLPRRMENARGTGSDRLSMICDMWEVRTDVKLSAKDFEIALPAGYTLDEKIPAQITPPADAVPPPPVELGVPVGSPAPEFSLKDATGKDISTSSLKGSTVVLEFFGTKFAGSLSRADDMKALYDAHRGSGVKFVGLACRENDEAAPKAHWQSHAMPYPLVPQADVTLGEFRVIAFPSYYVLDARGNVAAFFQGWPGRAALDEAIKAAAKN